jgi:glycosyltransferase involved in cell wall biosynthesis
MNGASRAPVIGFFGLLSDWVDVDYIAAVAKARPNWTIELLGRVDTDIRALDGLANVQFKSAVPFSELPAAARGFDVGLIPFRINALTRAVNPLKLLEYFAMGLPVVSTNLPEVARFQPAALIAETPEHAVSTIESILSSESDEKREARMRIARANSWERRAEDLVGWMQSCTK